MDNVIFAIDNNSDTHTVAKFMRHIDTKRALGDMRGNMVQAIGYWEGILETSYIMRKDDYLEFVQEFTKDQDAVLIAPHDQRQPAFVTTPNTKHVFERLGPIREITSQEAMASQAWTYNMTSGKYFVA